MLDLKTGDHVVCIRDVRGSAAPWPWIGTPPAFPVVTQVYQVKMVKPSRYQRNVIVLGLFELPGWLWNSKFFRKVANKPAFEEPRTATKELEDA